VACKKTLSTNIPPLLLTKFYYWLTVCLYPYTHTLKNDAALAETRIISLAVSCTTVQAYSTWQTGILQADSKQLSLTIQSGGEQ
jgi:hypothetical protein